MSIDYIILLLLSGLALWRVSRMIVLEDGPFFVFQRFRLMVGVYEDQHGVTADTWFGSLFTCPMCVSVWLGFPLALGLWFILYFWFDFFGLMALWWGLSGFASMLYRFTD